MVILDLITSGIDIMSNSDEIALRWMSQDGTDD